MLIAIILLAVIGVVIGWYFGWFRFSSRHDKAKPNVTVSIDKQKIAADKEKVLNRIKPASNSYRK